MTLPETNVTCRTCGRIDSTQDHITRERLAWVPNDAGRTTIDIWDGRCPQYFREPGGLDRKHHCPDYIPAPPGR